MSFELQLLGFYDRRGEYHILHGVSIGKRLELKHLFFEFWAQIYSVEETLEISFLKAVDENPKVLTIAKKIVETVGIDPDVLDINLLGALVHSYIDENNQLHKGYIEEINFYKSTIPQDLIDKEDTKNLISYEEYYQQMFALVMTETGDFEKAKAAIDNVPAELIEGFFKAKSDAIEKQKKDPDGKLDKLQKAKERYLKAKNRKEKVDAHRSGKLVEELRAKAGIK